MSVFRVERLREVRIVLAAGFFLGLTLMFCDVWQALPPRLSAILTSLQLIPAIAILFASGVSVFAGLLIVILLTFCFGRVYCSTLCPLGTLQDIFIRLGKRKDRKKRFSYRKTHYLLHYSILAFSVLSVLSGSMLVVNLLDPFSGFGRIVTGIAGPCIVTINNGVTAALEAISVYSFYTVSFREIGTGTIALSLLLLGIVAYLSLRHGRLFCNSICPAGAILGLLSRLSLFRISVSGELCNNCGACEKLCKAGCIDAGSGTVDYSSCINCFNCLSSCPSDAVVYAPAPMWKRSPKSLSYEESRRTFLEGLVIPFTATLIPFSRVPDSTSASPLGYHESKRIPISPPGSGSLERFTGYCTACHLCVSRCPTGVLSASGLEYGLSGIFQPKMNYTASFCNYDCTVCGEICPSGAILATEVSAKKLIQIGKATFVKDDCVVVAKKKDCAACSEHCPTKAVHTVPYEGTLLLPELNNDICIGCGACEHACPTTPRKAIYVTSNPVHLRAKKPTIVPRKDVPAEPTDFPF